MELHERIFVELSPVIGKWVSQNLSWAIYHGLDRNDLKNEIRFSIYRVVEHYKGQPIDNLKAICFEAIPGDLHKLRKSYIGPRGEIDRNSVPFDDLEDVPTPISPADRVTPEQAVIANDLCNRTADRLKKKTTLHLEVFKEMIDPSEELIAFLEELYSDQPIVQDSGSGNMYSRRRRMMAKGRINAAVFADFFGVKRDKLRDIVRDINEATLACVHAI